MFEAGAKGKTFTTKKGRMVVLRLAQKSDLLAMTEYMNQISAEDTFISFGKEDTFTKVDEAKYLDTVLDQMSHGNAVKLLAFCNNVLIGNADVTRLDRRSKHYGSIGISIKNGYREEGIGTVMMEVLTEYGRKMQLQYLQLSCYAINQLALALYQKLGYVEVGRVPKKILYKGNKVDEVIMVKSL